MRSEVGIRRALLLVEIFHEDTRMKTKDHEVKVHYDFFYMTSYPFVHLRGLSWTNLLSQDSTQEERPYTLNPKSHRDFLKPAVAFGQQQGNKSSLPESDALPSEALPLLYEHRLAHYPLISRLHHHHIHSTC